MASRTLEVKIVGDASKLSSTFSKAGRDGEKFGSTMRGRVGGAMKGLAIGVAGAGIALAGGLAVGLKSSIDAALESEESQKRLDAALKSVGATSGTLRSQIDNANTSLSQMSGFDDEDLQNAFSDLVRTTGDAKGSLKQYGLVADLARAKNIPLASAAKIVGRVMNGNTGLLKRYGIELKKGATAHDALAAMQRKFGGAAKAYGDTTAGQIDKAKVAFGNLKESIGTQLLPVVAAGAQKLSVLMNRYGPVIAEKLGKAIAWVQAHWPKIKQIILRVVAALAPVVRGALNAVKAVVQAVMAAIHGNWSQAWARVKQALGIAWQGIWAVMRAAGPILLSLAKQAGEAALNGIKSGLAALPGAVKSLAQAGADAFLAVNWSGIASSAGSAILSGIESALSALGSYVSGIVRGAINGLIDQFNAATKFSFKVDTHIPGIGSVGVSIDAPDVPHLAGGGIVTRPTMALIGEAGPEAVVPLGRGGIGGTVVVHVHGSVITEKNLVETIRRGINDAARRRGGIIDTRAVRSY